MSESAAGTLVERYVSDTNRMSSLSPRWLIRASSAGELCGGDGVGTGHGAAHEAIESLRYEPSVRAGLYSASDEANAGAPLYASLTRLKQVARSLVELAGRSSWQGDDISVVRLRSLVDGSVMSELSVDWSVVDPSVGHKKNFKS